MVNLQTSCPQCGATEPTKMGDPVIGDVVFRDKFNREQGLVMNIMCLNNWHTRYPDKPTIVAPNHPESPSEPAAPRSSQ